MNEQQVQLNICKYLRLQYPKVIFASDYAAGTKLTRFNAAMQKMMKSNRGYPDLFIAKPMPRGAGNGNMWHGLYLELKTERARVWLRDGRLSTDRHIQEQAAVLTELNTLGYCANFARGFDEAKRIIDWYLGGAKGNYGLLPPIPATMTKELAKIENNNDGELPF